MAPTEILARQHALTLRRLLAGSQVRRAELIGGLPANVRTAMLDEIAAGRIDLIVGTQAVLQEDVRFARLGLVVIDEQHKFGVRQRAALRQTAGPDPHYLVMTATPIPRTLTMTLFGDLDVSVSPSFRRAGRRYTPIWPATSSASRGGIRPQEARRRAAGLRHRAAGRGFGAVVGRERAGGLRGPGQRRAGGFSPGTDPRPHDERGERCRHGGLPPRRDAGARRDVAGGSRRRRAERHADDDRKRRAVRAGATAPAPRADRPRQASGLLLRLRRAADARIAGAAEGFRVHERRLSSWRRSTSAFAVPASFSARGSTACRLCAWPTCSRTPHCWPRPAATPPSSSPPIPASAIRNTSSCGNGCWQGTARRWTWATSDETKYG